MPTWPLWFCLWQTSLLSPHGSLCMPIGDVRDWMWNHDSTFIIRFLRDHFSHGFYGWRALRSQIDTRNMGNGWEGLVDSGKIRENSGNCGKLEIQHKQDIQSVETNKILGWPTNIHSLAKSCPESSSFQPLIHLLLLQRRDTKTSRGNDLPKVTQFIIRPEIQTLWFPLNTLKWHS